MRFIKKNIAKFLKVCTTAALFGAGFIMLNVPYASAASPAALFLLNPHIEIIDANGQKENFNFNMDSNTDIASKKPPGALNIQAENVDGKSTLAISYQPAELTSLKGFSLRFDIENQFDKYYRLVSGQWQSFDLSGKFFFGQELILFNSKNADGLLIIFNEPYGRLRIKNNELIIDYTDGRNATIDRLDSDISFLPVSKFGNEDPVLYEAKFPEGKEAMILYSADDLHAVFDEKFVERLKYFDLLKEKDPTFKTTFLIVADVYKRRGVPLNPTLISALESRGYIRFGFHGTYHSYPVDDPSNPVLFDDHFVDYSGEKSNDPEWLQDIILKGKTMLTEQGFDTTVFRAPQYQYSEESIPVLAQNGVHLAHMCQEDVYNPIRVATKEGWLWKIYDAPCDRGYIRIENGKESYDSMAFKKELALSGKETSFHAHIWELWSGDNPYDNNVRYHTFDRLVEYLAFLQEKDVDYNWQYAADYYRYLESLWALNITEQKHDSDDLTATLTLKEPLQTNVYLKLLVKQRQFVKSARINGEEIKFSQSRKNQAILEVPQNLINNAVLVVELTNDTESRVTAALFANPKRDFKKVIRESGKGDTAVEQKLFRYPLQSFLSKLDVNVIILLVLFGIYAVIFLAGFMRYRSMRKK